MKEELEERIRTPLAVIELIKNFALVLSIIIAAFFVDRLKPPAYYPYFNLFKNITVIVLISISFYIFFYLVPIFL